MRRLDEALLDSVEVHQRSDVPYGMFLSGGIDSSAILALMAQLNDRPVRAFTVGFSGTGVHDERDLARRVAAEVGADHVEVEFSENDFWSLLPEVAAAMDDPAADYAILPTFKLAQEASKDLKVILSGEGGDELFGGYGRYRSAMRSRLLGGRPMRRKGNFDGLGVLRVSVDGWRDGIAREERGKAKTRRTRLQIAQAVDCADWLPHDLLIKLDRCLMAHGLEGRTPFLDPRVAAVAYGLADDFKVRERKGKWILRRWLETRLPVAQPFSKKRGFTVPVGEWIARNADKLAPLMEADEAIKEICKPGTLTGLLSNATHSKAGFAAWTLLFYALWHKRHVRVVKAQGDVFDVLGG